MTSTSNGSLNELLQQLASAPSEDPGLLSPPLPCEFGRYVLEERIGAGGMGTVYRARDRILRRTVALKLPGVCCATDQSRHRFLEEARKQAALEHPNIATVYDAGTIQGQHYIAMEYFRGTTLRADIRARGMTLKDALTRLLPIARALRHTHHRHIVHGDLKPENVMRDEQGVVKVLDFGLARLMEEHRPREAVASSPETGTKPASSQIWGWGAGTPGYMAPEQTAGRLCDARTDIYAFGIIAHELLTGRRPLPGAPDSSLPEWVRRCLQLEPERRYGDAMALLDVLEQSARSVRVKRVLARVVAATCVGIAAVGLAKETLWRPGTTGELHGAEDVQSAAASLRQALPKPTPLTALAGAALEFATLSPSGKQLAYLDGKGLMLMDLNSGRRRRPIRASEANILCVQWYPDGEHLLASVADAAAPPIRYRPSPMQLYKVDARDGRMTALDLPHGHGCAYLDPTGQRIAYLDESAALTLEDVVTHAKARVDIDPSSVAAYSFSPDGRWLAVHRQRYAAGLIHNEIVAVAADSGALHTMLEDGQLSIGTGAASVTWLGDSSLAYARRGEAPGIWIQRIDPRFALRSGSPELLVPLEQGAYWISGDSTGRRIAYAVSEETAVIHSGTLRSAGRVTMPLTPLTKTLTPEWVDGWVDNDTLLVWSQERGGTGTHVLQSFSSGAREPLPFCKTRSCELFDRTHLLSLRKHTKDAAYDLVRSGIGDSAERVLPLFSFVQPEMAGVRAFSYMPIIRCARDVARCVSARLGDAAQWLVNDLDVETGSERRLFSVDTPKEALSLDVSRDGKTMASTGGGSEHSLEAYVQFRDSQGQPTKRVPLPSFVPQRLTFSPDGTGVYGTGGCGMDYCIFFVRLDGSVLQVASAPATYFVAPAISPDGTQLVVSTGSGNNNVWLLER